MAYLICENCNHYWQIKSEEEFWAFHTCDECGSPLLYVKNFNEYRKITKVVPESSKKTQTHRKANKYLRFWRDGRLILIAGALMTPAGILLAFTGTAWGITPLLLGIVLMVLSVPLSRASERRGMGWRKGHEGELIVTNCFRRLPEGYHILNDIQLPGAYGNMDHVVVGPTGVYVIETESCSGNYIVKGDRWFLNDELRKEEVRSPSIQAKRNAAALKEFLESRDIYVSWVNAVVAFLSESCTIMEEDEHCRILKPCQVPEHIMESRLMLGESKVKSIVDALRKHASEVW
ncbi:nuclease-related domain-containing protein [Methanothermobacter sp.]|uniref:nuclease-related domain-containing protein n=1 Tax=Methanothermobacter sp. TaxID=1884223 RepID=UPI0026269635|nr:nuclease-related domain-containing protein [Methanothermobacter sp.]MDI9615533.1 nuclease-related domain-containing protein [Methanothermobacter sp.]